MTGAVLVTVAGDGTLLDRRRVELVDDALPKIPYHNEGRRRGRGAVGPSTGSTRRMCLM
jgi:hypothetical protein